MTRQQPVVLVLLTVAAVAAACLAAEAEREDWGLWFQPRSFSPLSVVPLCLRIHAKGLKPLVCLQRFRDGGVSSAKGL